MRTEAAVLFEPNRPLRIVELEIPALRPGQVLVEIAYSGLCGSQILEIQGKRGPDPYLPHTLGHEGAGVVLETSPGVAKVNVGDRVVLSWIKASGAEVPSAIYPSKDGPINSGGISTFLHHAVISENRVTPLSADLPEREAALLGCAIPTGFGMVWYTAGVRAGNSVAVFGTGGIGLCAIMAARLRQAEPIIAIDISDPKLEHAKQVGATHTIHARNEDSCGAVLKLTAGRGVDFAFEAAGRQETMETAFRVVREKGGLCVLAGNLSPSERIRLDPFGLIKGKRIVGTWGGDAQPDRDVPLFADLFMSGRIRLDLFPVREYPLDEINQALETMERGEAGRVLVRLGNVDRPKPWGVGER